MFLTVNKLKGCITLPMLPHLYGYADCANRLHLKEKTDKYEAVQTPITT